MSNKTLFLGNAERQRHCCLKRAPAILAHISYTCLDVRQLGSIDIRSTKAIKIRHRES